MRQTKIEEWFPGFQAEKTKELTETRTEFPHKENPRRRKSFWEKLEEALPLREGYQEIKIPKTKGGYRNIAIPSSDLKKVQRRILRYLKRLWRVHVSELHGLSPGSSYVEHVKHHNSSRWIWRFDLKDAYPSANIAEIKRTLSQAILREIYTFYQERAKGIANNRAELIIKLTSFKGKLPQGAPTSPFLFYVFLTSIRIIGTWQEREILTGLFHKLSDLCPKDYLLSCYVDGFVISGAKPISGELQKKILYAVRMTGLEINQAKTRLLDCRHGAVMICGLIVDGKKRTSLPKKNIRRWRGIIHRVAREIEDATMIDHDLIKEIQKVQGFIASLKPIYGETLPPQIAKPYKLYRENLRTKPPPVRSF